MRHEAGGATTEPRDALAAIRNHKERDPYHHLVHAMGARVDRVELVDAWWDRFQEGPVPFTVEDAKCEAQGIAALGPAAQRLVAPALQRHRNHPNNWTGLMIAAAGSTDEITEQLPLLLHGEWLRALDDQLPWQRFSADLVGISVGRQLGRRLHSDLADERLDILMSLQDAFPPTATAGQQGVGEFTMGSLLMEAGSHGVLTMRWVDSLARTDCPPAVLGHSQGYLVNSPGRVLDWVDQELVRGHTELASNQMILDAVTTMALGQQTMGGNGLSPQDHQHACAVLGRLAALGANR